MRPCIHCGKPFEPPLKQVKICSKECRRLRGVERANMRYKPRGEARRECVQCGKTFKTSHGTQKTCGKECAREYRLLQVRKWHKDAAGQKEDAMLRRRCSEILAAVPPGTMTEAEGMEYARSELESKRQRRTRAGRRQTKKECVQCGKQFTTTLTQKITCGKECARSRADARKKALYDLRFKKEKTCVQCGKAFKPSRARTKICSKECVRLRQNAQVYQSYKRRRKKDLEKTCTECGKAFQTPRAWNVTCGKECARLRQKRLRIQEK